MKKALEIEKMPVDAREGLKDKLKSFTYSAHFDETGTRPGGSASRWFIEYSCKSLNIIFFYKLCPKYFAESEKVYTFARRTRKALFLRQILRAIIK